MAWAHLTERKSSGREEWVDLNLSRAFKIGPGKDGGTNIYFLSGGQETVISVKENPRAVSNLAFGTPSSNAS